MNPRLQLCVETYLFDEYDRRADDLRASIETAMALDTGYLPEKRRGSLAESFESARATFGLVEKVRAAEAALAVYVPNYRPLHRQVRKLQARTRGIDIELTELNKDYNRLSRSGEALDQDLGSIERRIAGLEETKRELEASVPGGWDEARKGYLALAGAEKKARANYRRNVDSAYEPIAELRQVIAQAEALAAHQERLEGLGVIVANDSADRAIDAIKSVAKAMSDVDGASAIKSKLSKARRALKGANPDRKKAAAQLVEGLDLFAADVAWRRRAASELAAGLEDYDDAIHDSIGLRLQERLTADQASRIAGCQSIHRDISLDF